MVLILQQKPGSLFISLKLNLIGFLSLLNSFNLPTYQTYSATT